MFDSSVVQVMKFAFVCVLLCCAFRFGCPSICGAEPEPTTKIQLNHEPSFKNGAPQTVRTKLTEFTNDGRRFVAFVYQFGGKTVGVEIMVGNASNDGRRTESSQLKVELLLKDGSTRRAPFRSSFGAANGVGVAQRFIAEFGQETKLEDIRQIVVSVDGHSERFTISGSEKKPSNR